MRGSVFRDMNLDLLRHATGANHGAAASRVPASTRCAEFVLSACPLPGESPLAVCARLRQSLEARAGTALAIMVYGALAGRQEIAWALHTELGASEVPVTWMEGAPCFRGVLAGVQVFAVSDRAVSRLRLDGAVVGSIYDDFGARHCLLGGLGPISRHARPAIQAEETFERLEMALQAGGFTLADVMRTWFYNEDILRWYNVFNRVRTAHYAGVRWRSGATPASTGIGARNPSGSCLTLAARAFRPLDARATVREIPSPLQCPAPAYGSSFSRAMELDCTGWRHLTVSGTASIAPDGLSAHLGDIERQIDLTMTVIEAIIRSRGMSYQDVNRATAYCKEHAYYPVFDRWCQRHGIDLPVVVTHNDVCRDDLLFELELDACVDSLNPGSMSASLGLDR